MIRSIIGLGENRKYTRKDILLLIYFSVSAIIALIAFLGYTNIFIMILAGANAINAYRRVLTVYIEE